MHNLLDELEEELLQIESDNISIKYQLEVDEIDGIKSATDPMWRTKTQFCMRKKAARFNHLGKLIKAEKKRLSLIRSYDIAHIFVDLARKEMDEDFFAELMIEAAEKYNEQGGDKDE